MNGFFNLRVSKLAFICWRCRKTMPKGTQKIAKNTCFICALLTLDRGINAHSEELKKLRKTKRNIIKNKDKWEKDLILNSI